jgi:hypothetical protein
MSEDLNTVAMWREINKLRDALNKLTGSQLSTCEIPWTDYSAISTIVGWSSFTSKFIYYRKIGSTILVACMLIGPSNSVNTTFSLPYTPSIGFTIRTPMSCGDNSGATVWGLGEIYDASAIATFFTGPAGGAWTAGNTKRLQGQFWYPA